VLARLSAAVKLNVLLLLVVLVLLAGELRVMDGDVVSTMNALAAIEELTLPALSRQETDQLWVPCANAEVAVVVVGVPLFALTARLNVPSIVRLQDMLVSASVAVKLNVTLAVDRSAADAGKTGVTAGGTVSTVKKLVVEVLVLFGPSQQVTDQLWVPSVKLEVAVMLYQIPFVICRSVWLSVPSIVRLQVRVPNGSGTSDAVQLNVTFAVDVLR